MTRVCKTVRVIRTGRRGYGYGYEILYPRTFKQAQERPKRMKNDWDRAKALLLAHLSHFLPVAGVQGRILCGFTRGLRVRVRAGKGTGPKNLPGGYPGYSLLLPLSLRVDSPHMLCGDRSKSPRLVLEATMKGIGAGIISRIHVHMGLSLFSANSFYFKFQFGVCVLLVCSVFVPLIPFR